MSAIIYWSIAIAVFMMLGTIGPLFFQNVLNINQSRLLFILVPGGMGLVLGVILVGHVSHPSTREIIINWGLLAAGITLVLFSVAYPVLNWAYKLADNTPSEMVVLGLMGFITLLLGLSNSFILPNPLHTLQPLPVITRRTHAVPGYVLPHFRRKRPHSSWQRLLPYSDLWQIIQMRMLNQSRYG